MFDAGKQFSFEAAHELVSAKESPLCTQLHGHSYKVMISVSVEVLNSEGMVLDFHVLSRIVKPFLMDFDHTIITPQDLEKHSVAAPANPTAENIALAIWNYTSKRLINWIEESGDDLERFNRLTVVVQETETCRAACSKELVN